MSEQMDELGVSVRDVLAAHFITWHDLDIGGPRGEWRCSCGLKFGLSDSAVNHVEACLLERELSSSSDVVVLAAEHDLFSFLDEYMNANGVTPHLAGLDATGTPFVAWLNESGGDEVYLSVTKLHEEDGGTVEYPITETPGQGETTSLTYPLTVLGGGDR